MDNVRRAKKFKCKFWDDPCQKGFNEDSFGMILVRRVLMKTVLGAADKNPKSFGNRLASFDKELAYPHKILSHVAK